MKLIKILIITTSFLLLSCKGKDVPPKSKAGGKGATEINTNEQVK